MGDSFMEALNEEIEKAAEELQRRLNEPPIWADPPEWKLETPPAWAIYDHRLDPLPRQWLAILCEGDDVIREMMVESPLPRMYFPIMNRAQVGEKVYVAAYFDYAKWTVWYDLLEIRWGNDG